MGTEYFQSGSNLSRAERLLTMRMQTSFGAAPELRQTSPQPLFQMRLSAVDRRPMTQQRVTGSERPHSLLAKKQIWQKTAKARATIADLEMAKPARRLLPLVRQRCERAIQLPPRRTRGLRPSVQCPTRLRARRARPRSGLCRAAAALSNRATRMILGNSRMRSNIERPR